MHLAEFSSVYFSVFFMKILSKNFPMFPSEKHPAFDHSFLLYRSFGIRPYPCTKGETKSLRGAVFPSIHIKYPEEISSLLHAMRGC